MNVLLKAKASRSFLNDNKVSSSVLVSNPSDIRAGAYFAVSFPINGVQIMVFSRAWSLADKCADSIILSTATHGMFSSAISALFDSAEVKDKCDDKSAKREVILWRRDDASSKAVAVLKAVYKYMYVVLLHSTDPWH